MSIHSLALPRLSGCWLKFEMLYSRKNVIICILVSECIERRPYSCYSPNILHIFQIYSWQRLADDSRESVLLLKQGLELADYKTDAKRKKGEEKQDRNTSVHAVSFMMQARSTNVHSVPQDA